VISHTAPPRAVGVVGWIFTLGGGTALLGGATGLVAGLVMAVVLPGAHAPVAKQTLVAICLWNGGLAALGAIVTRAGILFLELDEQGRRLLEGVAWFGLSVTTTVAALALAGLIGRFHPSTVLSRTVAAGRWWLICGGPCALALWWLRSPTVRGAMRPRGGTAEQPASGPGLSTRSEVGGSSLEEAVGVGSARVARWLGDTLTVLSIVSAVVLAALFFPSPLGYFRPLTSLEHRMGLASVPIFVGTLVPLWLWMIFDCITHLGSGRRQAARVWLVGLLASAFLAWPYYLWIYRPRRQVMHRGGEPAGGGGGQRRPGDLVV